MNVKTLPIIERWDCSGCGNCCRGTFIPLSDDDHQRLQNQKWDEHPDFEHIRTVIKQGHFGNHFRLAQRPDGSCVFLMDDNRCRIHAEFGADAKPLVCQMYPLQLVPQQQRTILTMRRSCPSAAAETGRELGAHRDAAIKLARRGKLMEQSTQPPRVTTGFQGTWDDVLPVTRLLEELTCDERYPLVRRLVHGARACYLLDRSKYGSMDTESSSRLLRTIAAGVAEDCNSFFENREPPDGGTRALFRQCAAEYLRLHSTYKATNSWGERWRLARAAVKFARGRGKTPSLHPDLPTVDFSDLEAPLGHFGIDMQTPFLRFYEANTQSLQYIIAARPKWPVTRSFRAIALAYPIALWLLRWMAFGRDPTLDDVIQLVTIMDRGQGYETLINNQHRRRVGLISRENSLERLITWYAR